MIYILFSILVMARIEKHIYWLNLMIYEFIILSLEICQLKQANLHENQYHAMEVKQKIKLFLMHQHHAFKPMFEDSNH